MEESIELFISFLTDIKHVSENTAISYKRDLLKMSSYFGKLGIQTPDKVNSTNINTYILWLEKNGCATSTLSRYIASMKSYFHYMLQIGKVNTEPTLMVKGPQVSRKEPIVLTIEEVDRLLEQPAVDNNKGIRDKALLELMYATGIRASEIVDLKMEDVNLELGYIVCHDKNKERIVPFGIPAKNAINNYVLNVRESILKDDTEYVFVNCSGKHMSRQGLWKILKYYGAKAGIDEKKITPHVLRHSFALHLVQNGANIFAVQEMMGHSVVATTQIYENMKGSKLRDEYTKNHPRNKKK